MTKKSRFIGGWFRICEGSFDAPLEVKITGTFEEFDIPYYDCLLEDGTQFIISAHDISWFLPIKEWDNEKSLGRSSAIPSKTNVVISLEKYKELKQIR